MQNQRKREITLDAQLKTALKNLRGNLPSFSVIIVNFQHVASTRKKV